MIGLQERNEAVPSADEDCEPDDVRPDDVASAANYKEWQQWQNATSCSCPLNDQAQVELEGETWAGIWDA